MADRETGVVNQILDDVADIYERLEELYHRVKEEDENLSADDKDYKMKQVVINQVRYHVDDAMSQLCAVNWKEGW